MYEAEYRLALRNSGFDGFRVLLFQQSGGFNQAGEADGFEMNVDFFLGIPERPQHGRRAQRRRLPDAALRGRGGRDRPGDASEAMEYLKEVFRTHRNQRLDGRMGAFLKSLPAVGGMAENAGKFARPAPGQRVHRGAR